MTLDGTYAAAVDRIVEGKAVILIEEEGRVVEELVLPVEELPAEGRSENARLELAFDEGDLEAMRADPEKTDRRLSEVKRRFDRLSKRPPKPSESDDAERSADDPERASGDDAAGESTGEAAENSDPDEP